MILASLRENRPLVIFLGLMLVSMAALPLLPRIPQDQNYHNFADIRALFGIPNVWNVVSNFPFVAVGAVGVARCREDATTIAIFTGVFLTGFGSSYYHWSPDDNTLFWDRLPMTIAFMAILASVVGERLSAKAGAVLLWPLLALGLFSLLFWRQFDDLRLYGWVQFFPSIALPFMFLLLPPRYTGTSYWIVAVVLYGIAKVFEHFDAPIYAAGSIVSGHTLKHVVSALACFVILRNFQTRRLIA